MLLSTRSYLIGCFVLARSGPLRSAALGSSLLVDRFTFGRVPATPPRMVLAHLRKMPLVGLTLLPFLQEWIDDHREIETDQKSPHGVYRSGAPWRVAMIRRILGGEAEHPMEARAGRVGYGSLRPARPGHTFRAARQRGSPKPHPTRAASAQITNFGGSWIWRARELNSAPAGATSTWRGQP